MELVRSTASATSGRIGYIGLRSWELEQGVMAERKCHALLVVAVILVALVGGSVDASEGERPLPFIILHGEVWFGLVWFRTCVFWLSELHVLWWCYDLVFGEWSSCLCGALWGVRLWVL